LPAQSATTTFTRTVTVASGVFAPGHLGELTPYLPFELVDDVLEQTGTTQQRLRDLPSRVGVYFVLALGLFPRVGYAQVWAKLTGGLAGLAGLAVARPSEKALRDLRRLGPAPLQALFEVVAGPLGQPRTPGVCFAGLRTVAFDGCHSLKVPDTDRNRSWLGRILHKTGFAGHPTLRLMGLVETGTRGLLGAALGSARHRGGGEVALARRLLGHLGPGMLVLADRAFDTNAFLTEAAATGAQLLVRTKATRAPRVLAHLSDGSYLTRIGRYRNGRQRGRQLRVVDADLAMSGADGSQVGDRYRLITTLTDHHRYPAEALIRLYHERWEIETAYLALRHTLLAGHLLRSGDRPGLEQETWALLTVYQLLRRAMADAIETRPGTDPDRACFTTALETARTQLTKADGICGPTSEPGANGLGANGLGANGLGANGLGANGLGANGLGANGLGEIGRAVLATLLPARRPRYSARTVKCGTSRYAYRDPTEPRPDTPTAITAIDITIHTPPLHTPPPTRPAPPPTTRTRVTALMNTEPHRGWTGHELAAALGWPPRNMLTRLAEWTRLGFFTRVATSTYTLNTPTGQDP
jgi:Insertion element 4 transposase N-terminal/Transposase DDE domain